MDAIILAGGLGTRLSSLFPSLPKALAPIQGTPFLEILLAYFSQFDSLSQIVLALGHQSSLIEEFLQKREKGSLPIVTSVEKAPLGTGGAILQALKLCSSKTVLIANGDSFFHFSFQDFYNYHREKKSMCTLACRWEKEPSRYGVIQIDANHQILAFSEKPSKKERALMSGGVYLIERELFSFVSEQSSSLERDFFPKFLSFPSFAYLSPGFFIDIGVPASYFEAQNLLKPWIGSLCPSAF